MNTDTSPLSLAENSYRLAIAGVEKRRAQEKTGGVRDEYRTTLLTHGERTEHVIVLLHGFTSCPLQFNLLAAMLFEQGHNVLMPLMPRHGLQDRLTRATSHLTAADFIEYGCAALDLAAGLGRRVLVMGISAGGAVAAWLAQNRSDVDTAVPISAMLGLSIVPSGGTRLFEKLLRILPDFYMWWDPRTRAANPYALPFTYPGYSTRALGELLCLGISVRQQAAVNPPAASRIVMVINENEPAVNNVELNHLYAAWERFGTVSLANEIFEKSLKLPHDLVTPDTPGLDFHLVNRRLARLVAAETGAVIQGGAER